MNRLLFLGTFLFAAYLIGCDDKPTTPGSTELWPMAVGNYWIGIKQYRNRQGHPQAEHLDTLRIERTVEIDGETWYEFSDSVLRTIRADGVWWRLPEPGGGESVSMFAKYPTAVGDTFSTAPAILTSSNDTIRHWMETMLTDSIFAVPFGTISCHFYAEHIYFSRDTMEGLGSERWALRPGIGPVFMYVQMRGPASVQYQSYSWKLVDMREGGE